MKGSSSLVIILRAPLMIKLIVFILLVCSIVSVAVILLKISRIKTLNKLSDDFESDFWASKSLDKLFSGMHNGPYDPMSNMFCAAMIEWKDILSKNIDSFSAGKRIERVTNVVIRKHLNELEDWMGFLAAIGTNGVIIGIFGTVLGIKNGFSSIAAMKGANVSVIAPIISEALIATAIGLIAAIPAAIYYNIISAKINDYLTRMENFQDELCTIIVRNTND